MRKISSFAAIALAVQLCHSMEFLSPEGRAAAQRLKHAEFIMTSDGKISEIKLKETKETIQYRAAIKTGINGKLVEFFAKNFPRLKPADYQKDIDEFPQIFDRHHSGILHSHFGLNVLNEYCAAMFHLFYSSNVEELNNEIHDILLPILDQYYKEITLHIEPYISCKSPFIDSSLKCSEENLKSFSTEISPESFAQLPQKYAFSRGNIRIIIADSILAGFETLGLLSSEVINFYKNLMIKNPKTDEILLSQYDNLLRKSDFVRFATLTSEDFHIMHYKFKQKTDTDRYINNVKQMISMSLDSIPRRQTLVLFLLTHEYMCDKCKNTLCVENKLLFEDLGQSGDAGASYPIFSVNVDPNDSWEALTFTATEVKPSVLGYEKLTFNAPAILTHEFRHGYHIPLGFGNHDDSTYLLDYLNNPFMKDLLFQDFDKICSGLEQHITKILDKLSVVEAVQFSEQIKSYFTPPWMPGFLENVPSPSNKISFAKTLSGRLVLVAIVQIWDNPEEIQNIIGVQVVGKILFVNRLSDLDAFVADGRKVRWTHLGADKERLKKDLLLEEKDKAPVTNPAARQFIADFYATYGILSDAPLNHPTTDALQALEILHDVKGLLEENSEITHFDEAQYLKIDE